MGDRLQRILARQQERERAMRERELLKTPNVTPQQPTAPYVRSLCGELSCIKTYHALMLSPCRFGLQPHPQRPAQT
jgi:hypothetical protein